MSLSQSIVEEELALLGQVRERLERVVQTTDGSEASVLTELHRLRGLLLNHEDTKDIAAINAEWHRQEALLRQLRAARGGPTIDPRSPYFAHLRLEDANGSRDLCIGRAPRLEHGLRIVDWRNAPISRVFYRYRQGEDYEEEFGGRVQEGRVLARRVVRIEDAELLRVDAPEGVYRRSPRHPSGWERSTSSRPRLGGGKGRSAKSHAPGHTAEHRLGSGQDAVDMRADKRLPEITSLIDPEQFGLITRPAAGFLAIRGMAGSGKTTVALHRIAYLSYEDEAVDSAETLVLVFSEGLRRYVEHLLPSLGLEHVPIRTYQDWAREQRRRHFPRLPRDVRQDTPWLIRQMKLHPAMGRALEEHIRRVPGPATRAQAQDDWLSLLLNEPVLRESFERHAPEVFSPRDLQEFADWSRRRGDEVLQRLDGDKEVQAELDPEDDPLLLRAWQLRVGPLRRPGSGPLQYRHVVVDEVQDFAPLEIQILLDCLDESKSITLAGDTQQHVIQTSGFASWSAFFAELGMSGSEIDTLRIPYRSTSEIVEFSLRLLGDLREETDLPRAPRSGPPVELFRFTDRGACVAFLADALLDLRHDEPLASVALLAPSPEIAAAYAAGFEQTELGHVQLVEEYDFSFAPGVEVTDIEQTKGLEFDYVVLLEVESEHYPDDSYNRRLLHVGATRGIHQLWVTSTGDTSAIVRGIIEA